MEVTLQELYLFDSLYDYSKKKSTDANGDQFMEWKVSFGVVQILRDGVTRGRSLELPPEQYNEQGAKYDLKIWEAI
jgi:hypothetical protein